MTVTVNNGGLSNLNHIIFMLQENRAFDNYFGKLAEYRVNHQPPIHGAQLSDVNDLHTLPSDYQICNPQGPVLSGPSMRGRSASRTCRRRGTRPTTTCTWSATTGCT